MASVRQRGKKKAWYALFRDAAGKLVERRTKAKSKREAQDLADEMEKLARPTAAMATVENMRKVIADLHLKYLGSEAPKMSVRAFLEHWLLPKKNEIKGESLHQYQNTVNHFLRYLGARADEDLFRIRKQDIVLFRDDQLKRVGAVSVNQMLKNLKMIFRAAHADCWIPENPTVDVKKVRVPDHEKVRKKPFSPDELRLILDACPDEEWRAMTRRGYFTGQRLRDICLMVAGQEDLEKQRTTFRTSKTGRLVIVPMHPEYLEWALEQPSHDNPGSPLHPRAYASVMAKIKANASSKTATESNQFTRILAASGLRDKDTHRKTSEEGQGRKARRKRSPLSFHSLRHSFNSHLAAAGVGQKLIQDIIGHETVQANDIYTHFPDALKMEAVLKLPRVFSPQSNLSNPPPADAAGG